MVDKEVFRVALTRVIAENSGFGGIGRLSEKSIHKVLKLYYEPNIENHEVEYLGSVADIMNDSGIIEIQRKSFEHLVPKLNKFLPQRPVTVIYPLTVKKRVKWIDKKTGEMTQPRGSIKGKTLYDSAYELFKISSFLTHKNLTVRLLLLDCEEYRYLDGWDSTGKKGATKIDSIPTDIIDELVFESKCDYMRFMPDTLGDEFLAKEYVKAVGSRSRYSYYGLRLLCELGLLARRKGEGRSYIYSRIK